MKCDQFTRQIWADLQNRFPTQRKTQRDKLSILVATMLEVKSANLMELGAGLPIETTNSLSRFQWIKRFLGNELVDVDAVMGSFSREALALASANGQQPVLIIDQSTISQHDRHELVMVALRVRKRAIPIAWGVYKASGSLGWKEQSEVLETARSFLPDGCKPMLMGDRFYGNGETISWCQTHGWDYCLRLKGSLVLTPDLETAPDQERIFYDPSTDPKSAYHFSGRCTINALWAAGEHQFQGAYLTRRRIQTNIQMLKDKKSKEPWFIATSKEASPQTAREYGKRWGIEAMFSDFKSRGFGLTQSQLRSPGKLSCLILIMAFALYWAVSTGLWAVKNPVYKKTAKNLPLDQWFHSSKLA